MAALYDTILAQYDDYEDKLTNQSYRLSEVAQNITIRGAALTTLYMLSHLEGNSTHKTAILAELAALYVTTITAPTIPTLGESENAIANAKAVTAGVNAITFDLALTSALYALFITCYDSSGNNMSYKISSKATTGFSVEVAANGFIDYKAIIV